MQVGDTCEGPRILIPISHLIDFTLPYNFEIYIGFYLHFSQALIQKNV